ncbi:cytoplasmic protein [Gordonia sp. CPCC 205515]|uniref:cytoplasmic protein n=1 Tax=Gordonia sp. CPCC 205515 TaxID=3140791 RepID=UPI003AF3742B
MSGPDTLADDPIVTDPDLYRVVLENEHVRVLEYRDKPGDATHTHHHPDSVMIPLAHFTRRLTVDDRHAEVTLEPLAVRWLDAQHHRGENIGATPTHALFVELKDHRSDAGMRVPLGPR